MQNMIAQTDQDSRQSSTQAVINQTANQGFRFPNVIFPQQLLNSHIMQQKSISEEDQNDISAAFIDLDLLFLKYNIQKKAHAKLNKDKEKEAQKEIGIININSKLLFAECLINIRYNKETKDLLEKCLRNAFFDYELSKKLLGPETEATKEIQQEITQKLNSIRLLLK